MMCVLGFIFVFVIGACVVIGGVWFIHVIVCLIEKIEGGNDNGGGYIGMG